MAWKTCFYYNCLQSHNLIGQFAVVDKVVKICCGLTWLCLMLTDIIANKSADNAEPLSICDLSCEKGAYGFNGDHGS